MSQATLELPTTLLTPAFGPEHPAVSAGIYDAAQAIRRPAVRAVVERDVADESNRAARRRWMSCIRFAIEADTYESDSKLSIALDRLLDELEQS